MERPNILFLMTDQHRWDALGCAGNPKVRTPNLDRLAQTGVHFTNACTPTPVCVAARMSLITGHRGSTTHWVTNRSLPGPLPELPTLMTLLSHDGYWTQGVGKMHFRGRHYGLRHLFTMEECVEHIADDDYLMYLRKMGIRTRFPMGLRDLLYFQPQTSGIPVEHSMNNWVADRAIEFLTEHQRYRGDQPFFLWSSWASPHPPFAPCEPYDSMYDPAEMDLPRNATRPLSTLPSFLWPARGRLDGAHADPERMQRIRALYYGLVTHVDEALGRIIDTLDDLGQFDNTIVLFFSDHGEMMGDQGLSQKNCPYEPSIRVPLILRWPGKTAEGVRCEDLVGLTDVLPTFIEGLGLDYPQQHPRPNGQSLLGREGGGLLAEREVYFIDYGFGRQRWVAGRTSRYKYSVFADGGIQELYDLRKDPAEVNDIAQQEPDVTQELRAKVLEYERLHGLPGSFRNGRFLTYPRPKRVPSEEEVRTVVVNEGPWPKRLPQSEGSSVETYAQAFTRAIAKEDTISPSKLSLRTYKERISRLGPTDPGGESLLGTPWEQEWLEA